MSNEITSYVKAIDATEDRFCSTSNGLLFNSEKGFAVQLLKNNSHLMAAANSNLESLQQAITNISSIGLSLNPAKKQAYLITRSIKIKDANNRDKWEKRIFLEPSYIGLCDLATGIGAIEWIQAICVYSEDEFMDNGPGEKATHKYKAFAKKQERGDFVGVYCVAKTVKGDFLNTIMTIEKIHDIRARSEAWKAGQYGPWASDFEEMAKKTVIRNAFKMWPKTKGMERIEEAVNISNENEGFEPILTSPEIKDYTIDQKEFLDGLIESSDDLGMFCFFTSLDECVQTNLYHSFEKGTKGKYQKIINSMLQNGRGKFEDYKIAFLEAAQNDDNDQGLELLEGLTQETIDYIIEKSDLETSSFVSKLKEDNK